MMISDGYGYYGNSVWRFSMQEGYNNNSSIESQMPLSPFAIEQEFPAFSPLDQHSVDLIQLL